MMRHRLSAPLFAAMLLLGGCNLLGPTQPDDAIPAAAPIAAERKPACAGQPLRKVLVTGFPLRYPEQIRPGEYIGWAQTTGEELSRLLAHDGRLRVTAAAQRFPFASIEAEPVLERNVAAKLLLTDWAAQAKAQYVVAGVHSDFGQADKWLVVPERQLVIDAYIFDGIAGVLLAHRQFARRKLLINSLPRSIAPGTREFAQTRLGDAYLGLLAETAAWAADIIPCLPLPARVTRVDGRRLQLDVGADSGIQPGTTIRESLRSSGTDAIVREVHATHSVADLGFHRNPQTVKPGDVFYVSDAQVRNKP